MSAGISSQLLGRVRRYKLLPLGFLCIGVGAVVALAFSTDTMSSTKFEIILFLIGIGFGPTAPLTQVALQNTVPIRDLGAALGAMNFARTLMGTILVAVFGAIVLAAVPLGTPADTLSQRMAGATSVAAFSTVFLTIAGDAGGGVSWRSFCSRKSRWKRRAETRAASGSPRQGFPLRNGRFMSKLTPGQG